MDKMLESINKTKDVINSVAAGKDKVAYKEIRATLISTPGIYFGPGMKVCKIVKQLGEELGIEVEDNF